MNKISNTLPIKTDNTPIIKIISFVGSCQVTEWEPQTAWSNRGLTFFDLQAWNIGLDVSLPIRSKEGPLTKPKRQVTWRQRSWGLSPFLHRKTPPQKKSHLNVVSWSFKNTSSGVLPTSITPTTRNFSRCPFRHALSLFLPSLYIFPALH